MKTYLFSMTNYYLTLTHQKILKNIEVTVKYLGAAAEACQRSEEYFEVEENNTLEDIHKLVLEKYKPLKELLYKVAHNQKLTTTNPQLKHKDELAFLPPFTGG